MCNAATGARSTYIARQDSCSAQLTAGGQHASTELKACLQAICLTRPDLGPSASSDYAVSVLDVMESERIFEGKGMMGWLLAEQQGLAQVTGRLIDDPATRTSGGAGEAAQTLEIVLELVPVSLAFPHSDLCLPETDWLALLSETRSSYLCLFNASTMLPNAWLSPVCSALPSIGQTSCPPSARHRA